MTAVSALACSEAPREWGSDGVPQQPVQEGEGRGKGGTTAVCVFGGCGAGVRGSVGGISK